MQRKTKITTWSVALGFLLVCMVIASSWSNRVMADSVKDAPYQAIVKINTYTLDEYNNLSIFSSGSGIIFDASGLVLTNYHVTTIEEEFDNSERETSFQVCLTEDPGVEPVCDWTGQMVAKDKDLDVAILQIKEPPSEGEMFPYLDLDQLNANVTNDTLTVLGYPAIGDETITITEGIISGKVNKYNKDWLKTDAVTSFGSSGGAAINQYGYVIGLISRAHSDLLGSLGYLINVSSLSDWIEANRNQASQTASFEGRISDLSAKQKALEETDTYQNDKPFFSIVKPNDWDFDYQNENALMIHKKNYNECGIVGIMASPFPIPASTDFVMTRINQRLLEVGALSLLNINKDEDLVINGLSGKKVTLSIMGETQSFYYFVLDNYFLEISYDYGYTEKDQAMVDEIINSLSATPGQVLTPVVQYENDSPKFYLSSNASWPILDINSKERAAEMYNVDEPKAFVSAGVAKLESSQKDFNNDDYLNYIKGTIDTVNSAGAMLDINFDIMESNAHYQLNDELTDVIMLHSQMTKPSTGDILGISTEYYLREGDYYIGVDLSMFTDDITEFQSVLSEVQPILNSLSLVGFQELDGVTGGETNETEDTDSIGETDNVLKDTLKSSLEHVKNNKLIWILSLFGVVIIILVIVFIKIRGKRKSTDPVATTPPNPQVTTNQEAEVNPQDIDDKA